MSLAAGTKLGAYEVLGALGAGGMGEVYRARDTRLGRNVAIKVLPDHLTANADSRQRFEREAKAISSLQHPHICVLHDVGHQDGIDFLVMEYLEGETLAARLSKGAVPVEQALKIGAEIADALDKAHRQGIVHRDLKPGNVMLTKSGAKLMDFGLAKPAALGAAAGSGPAPLLSAAMTMTSPSPHYSPLTSQGMLVGTVQYMSPEQLQGVEADARSDIFALGAVLYEMFTGRRAFEGKSQLSLVTAILEKDPEPIATVQPDWPAGIDHVVQRCLAKNPEERYQSALDVKFELKWQAEHKALPVKSARTARWERTAWIAALITVVAVAAAGLWWGRRPATGPMIQAYLPPPSGAEFLLVDDDTAGPAVLSPSGASIAFTARKADGTRMLWIEALREGTAKPLPGTENGTYPFWSPDEKWVGFFADNKLKKAPLNGGPALPLADATRGRGGSWNQFGQILYAPTTQTGIFMVDANSGTPVAVTQLSAPHTTHRWPLWLPDGKRFLYLATNHSHPEASASNGIWLGSVDGKTRRMLIPSASSVALAPGYLIYVLQDALMAQTFDAASAKLSGEPVPVALNVLVNPGTWRGAFDVSNNGILVYQAGESAAGMSQLEWESPKNQAPEKLGDADHYYQVRFSPDGTRLAYAVGDPHSVLWAWDLRRGSRARLTFEGTSDDSFAWSPDGKRIAYAQRQSGPLNIFVRDSSGSGAPQLLYGDEFDKNINDWSPDGKYLLFDRPRKNNEPAQLFILPLDGDRKPQLLLEVPAPFYATQGTFSPDGKWLAYTSNESGSSEIYLTTFPRPSGKWQVSVGGGTQARWMADGKSMLYLATDQKSIMQVPVAFHGDVAEMGVAHPYAKAAGIKDWHSGMSYDVAHDGRVLITKRTGEQSYEITVLVNWTAALKK